MRVPQAAYLFPIVPAVASLVPWYLLSWSGPASDWIREVYWCLWWGGWYPADWIAPWCVNETHTRFGMHCIRFYWFVAVPVCGALWLYAVVAASMIAAGMMRDVAAALWRRNPADRNDGPGYA